MEIKQLGQYFTTNEELRNKVVEFILNDPAVILEPSVGQGDLIQAIGNKYDKIKFDMYEIDDTIKMLDGVPDNIIYGDFIQQKIEKKYKTIVGNPPYVKTPTGNLYIDFISKCQDLLNIGGELIFIIPSDFFKLTSAAKLLNNMMTTGTFTHIYHPHKENLFIGASIDVLIFRYCKDTTLAAEVMYNNELLYIINNNGLITFNECKNTSGVTFGDYFDVSVGLVSGKEDVYKSPIGNIEVMNGQDQFAKYIYIEKYPCGDAQIDDYLLLHKTSLINRKIRKFNEANWFEWGAPRNIKLMREKIGIDCIYIYNLTRKNNIAFRGKVAYFGGGLIMLVPKQDVQIDKIIEYLNSDGFKSSFMFSARFKIGHRQISNSYIPQDCL